VNLASYRLAKRTPGFDCEYGEPWNSVDLFPTSWGIEGRDDPDCLYLVDLAAPDTLS